MLSRNAGPVAALVALAWIVSPGCVSKKMFRQNVEETSTRVAAVESGVEANEKRIKDLREDTDSRLAELDSRTERATEIGRSAMSQAEQADAKAEKAARGRLIWVVTLSNDQVKFSFNQAAIPSDAAALLDDLVRKIMSYDKAVYVEIEGHTDATGGEDYNYVLGERRASAVRDYLAKSGIPLHALNVISFGESVPVADNSTPTGRAQNRRVVVRVLE
jgi:outer membrane protein OmpA-like peptidoglycan-associated protein